jgi:beta-glucosidase
MHSESPQFTPPSPETEARVETLLQSLTLEEKIDLLGGHPDQGSTRGNARVGIPEIRMSDGPLGVHWWSDTSTAYPALIAAAASWDRKLVRRMGRAIGRDCRARGVHMLLGPGVNIYRSALCGRNFEYMGEDPCLAAALATEYIRGVQSWAVSTTVKHFAVNYQDYDRHTISSDVDERTLNEVYYPAFRAAVERGGTGAVMTAYNRLNGVHCAQHPGLILDTLKGAWGFDGVAVSDWVSTYSALRVANGGLDIEMPTAAFMNRERLLPLIRNGMVSESVIDDKIRRQLRLAVCFGWLDHDQKDESIPLDDPETAAVALDVARGGVTLLKNDRNALPLDASSLRRCAVVGPWAAHTPTSAGGSAYCRPNHAVTILDGIRTLVGESVEIVHEAGPNPYREWGAFGKNAFHTPAGEPGIAAAYFNSGDLSGEPAVVCTEKRFWFDWGAAMPFDELSGPEFSVRLEGVFVAESTEDVAFYARANDSVFRIWIDDEPLFAIEHESGDTLKKVLPLTQGKSYAIRAEWRKTRYYGSFFFGFEPAAADTLSWKAALEAVESADAAIVCIGFDATAEGEGHDRPFAMHPDLEAFVAQAAERNDRTIAVLTAGGNVAMDAWIDNVRGLLHAWYPGQEGGTALAEALFGAVNPSGKLPATFEARLEDRSSYGCYHDEDNDGRVTLADGVFGGYRHVDAHGVEPRFPFGFGLSYTTFAYENLRLSADEMDEGDTITVSVDITNTGKRAGAEVVQLYIADVEAAVARPVKELKDFAKVRLQPGQTGTVAMTIDRDALVYYDLDVRGWRYEPGEFTALIGASSRDIRLQAPFLAR